MSVMNSVMHSEPQANSVHSTGDGTSLILSDSQIVIVVWKLKESSQHFRLCVFTAVPVLFALFTDLCKYTYVIPM